MSCDICEGYSSYNCPCCQIHPEEFEEAALEADPTKLDIVIDDVVMAVCNPDELLTFMKNNNLGFELDDVGDVQIFLSPGKTVWAFRQHEDSIDLYERSHHCNYPVSMHIFNGAIS